MTFMGGILSCSDDDVSIESHQDICGAGHFYAINVTAKDTVETALGLNLDSDYKTINARIGDGIKLMFVPKSIYNRFSFIVTYNIFGNEIEVKNKNEYAYTFTLTGMNSGRFFISMNAASTEQQITSSGKVAIHINE